MPEFQVLHLFQGIATLAASEPKILFGRIFLIFLGFALIYLGQKGGARGAADDPDGARYGGGQCRRVVLRGRTDGDAVSRSADQRDRTRW